MGLILGALLAGGSLIGAGIAARRNRQNNQQISQLAAQNTGAINQFANQYGGVFDPATQRATTGANMYANALGLNGAAGNATAQSAFQAGPGYQFGVDQALQGVQRSAAAGGMLASGNTLDASLRTAHGLANQEYQQWLGNLAPYNGMEMAGLENRVGLGSQVLGARLQNTTNQQDRLQAQNTARQGMIGNLLGFAGNIAGRTGGFGLFGGR